MDRSKTEKKAEKEIEKAINIPLDWNVPDNVPTQRVTNAVVQFYEGEFVVSFFEQRAPFLISEEDRKKAMQLKSVKALCVARISVTPERLESFHNAFKHQLERYKESMDKKI